MKAKWTKEQQQVICLRKRNILVSAAAGSGKTAVLVERIRQMVLDKEHPVDIDRLLVVTFTNAAAAEMRERISQALERQLKEEPGNAHLERQLTLLHNSQITTIDSFCLYLIRNYFERIDLDPSFRIGDENELKLMKQDVAEKVLEEAYEEKTEAFTDFVESFATGKRENGLSELILQLYELAISHPRPDEWLEDCRKGYGTGSPEELLNSPLLQEIVKDAKELFSELLQDLETAEAICQEPEGPKTYLSAIEEEKSQLEDFLACETYEEMINKAAQVHFNRLKAAPKTTDEELKQLAMSIRSRAKETLTKYCSQYLSIGIEHLFDEFAVCRDRAGELVRLTKNFMEAFSEEKREKGIVDFSDLEHFALEILLDGQGKPTAVAEEFSEYFEEIMIDEYQDSNQVQELLLSAMKKKERNNIFMVGDVKQSIYKFRLARPELFMDKLETYTDCDSENQKIILGKNFRSRFQVLESVNYIFRKLMRKELGNIAYDEKAALYPGAVYPEGEEGAYHTEVLFTDAEDSGEDLDEQELEARAIGEEILRLVRPEGGLSISDDAREGFRKTEYQDIVVLFRTMSGWAETFSRVFEDMGIPVRTESSTGFFAAKEVQTLLSVLHILDNPRQDIPMVAVLKAPFFDFSNEELAFIRAEFPDKCFYEALKECSLQGKVRQEIALIQERQALLKNISDELLERIEYFLGWLDRMRSQVMHNSVARLLQLILKETHYMEMAEALPGGMQRKANILLLEDKARDYEKTSYHGVFHFLRYIEQIQKMDVDFGEASFTEEQDQVRFMSIHKSKGLEFPVVFVAGMAKQFNLQDTRSKVVLHPELGIGMDLVDVEKRWKRPTLLKRYMQGKMKEESLGEELRVLYVAMTRAKEKLYLSAVVNGFDKLWKKFYDLRGRSEEILPKYRLMQASSYLDWLMAALTDSDAWASFAKEQGLILGESFGKDSNPEYFSIQKRDVCDLLEMEMQEQLVEAVQIEKFIEEHRRPGEQQELEERISFIYPYEREKEIPSTISVTELKKRDMHQQEEQETELFEEEPVIPYIPEFMQEEAEAAGNVRGNAYHKVMECLDFLNGESLSAIEEQLRNMVERNVMTKEETTFVSVKKIYAFLKSNMGRRMVKAAKEGKLYRESQFVMGLSAGELGYEAEGEPVLVQGIIDVYFEEEGKLVLVDYKTDRVSHERELAKRYRVQLDLYEKALMRGKKMEVKERMIYSFHLGREILL